MSLAQAKIAPSENTLLALWLQQLAEHKPASAIGWLETARQSAVNALAASGRLPGRKDERWKYFSLQALENAQPNLNFSNAGISAKQSTLLKDAGAVFLPLQVGTDLDIPANVLSELPVGLRLLTLDQASEEPGLAEQLKRIVTDTEVDGPSRIFEALNTASLDEALVIHVAAGTDAGRVHIEWQLVSAKQLANFRVFVLLEKGASLQLLETFPQGSRAEDSSFSLLNLMTQVELAEASQMDHLRVQAAGAEQHLLQFASVNQSSESHYRYTGFELGGGLVRNDLNCQLNGSAASADLAAAFIGNGESCIDHHIVADHHALNCRSDQNFRGVLGGRSRGVFNGKALIRPGADGSSVRQSNANLLLSDLAEMNTKPELEIYADEVEASHGATVGQLDELALFYIQSRGISETDARRMLTGAFCRSIGIRLSDRKLVEQIEALLDEAMPGTGSGMEFTSEDKA